jgi:hypothetical protein
MRRRLLALASHMTRIPKREERLQVAQYWIVGATVDGQDMTDAFVKHGFWFADAVGAQEPAASIRPGDRIAIKRMLGQGATEVAIKALGVVEEVGDYEALNFRMIYVTWISLREERRVPFRGWGAAIHGPYAKTDPVIKDVFPL